MLNMTLLAQAVHFGIAYILLDRILLRFGARLIITEQKQAEALQKLIAQATETVAEKSAHNEREWQQAHKILYAKKPRLELPTKVPVAGEAQCKVLALSEAEIDKLARETQQAIVERVAHD
jgi:hypothetical protein